MSTTSTPEKAKARLFCDYSEIAMGILQIGFELGLFFHTPQGEILP
jgi:hypothetical protein